MSDLAYHEPVLLQETVALLAPSPGKLLVDGTLGGGGHSEAFLQAGARVVGLDQDPEALAFATARLRPFGDRFQAVRTNFSRADEALERLGIGGIDGALLDIGVSSHHFDEPGRGFSFRFDGPLDMRMDPDGPVRAADIVNGAPEAELRRIFWEYGEESDARRIAQKIVAERETTPFETTGQLAACVERVHPRRGPTHPATKVFQALRIAVNRELEVLAEGLEALTRRLVEGGRFAVISFHSKEDRIVKNFFKERSRAQIDHPAWPAPRPNPLYTFRTLTPKRLQASEPEKARNPRSRSASLRAVERITPHVR